MLPSKDSEQLFAQHIDNADAMKMSPERYQGALTSFTSTDEDHVVELLNSGVQHNGGSHPFSTDGYAENRISEQRRMSQLERVDDNRTLPAEEPENLFDQLYINHWNPDVPGYDADTAEGIFQELKRVVKAYQERDWALLSKRIDYSGTLSSAGHAEHIFRQAYRRWLQAAATATEQTKNVLAAWEKAQTIAEAHRPGTGQRFDGYINEVKTRLRSTSEVQSRIEEVYQAIFAESPNLSAVDYRAYGGGMGEHSIIVLAEDFRSNPGAQGATPIHYTEEERDELTDKLSELIKDYREGRFEKMAEKMGFDAPFKNEEHALQTLLFSLRQLKFITHRFAQPELLARTAFERARNISFADEIETMYDAEADSYSNASGAAGLAEWWHRRLGGDSYLLHWFFTPDYQEPGQWVA